MKAEEVKEPGFYWSLYEGIWSVVEVSLNYKGDSLVVWSVGNESEDYPREFNGELFGPLTPPQGNEPNTHSLTPQQIKVSAKMVNTGVRILRESGRLYAESSADHLLVREILETALEQQ